MVSSKSGNSSVACAMIAVADARRSRANCSAMAVRSRLAWGAQSGSGSYEVAASHGPKPSASSHRNAPRSRATTPVSPSEPRKTTGCSSSSRPGRTSQNAAFPPVPSWPNTRRSSLFSSRCLSTHGTTRWSHRQSERTCRVRSRHHPRQCTRVGPPWQRRARRGTGDLRSRSCEQSSDRLGLPSC